VEQVVKSAKKINKNIMVIVDATQSIPSEMIDVKKTAVDFMICSAHKMCGPTGIGLVYGKYELLSNFNRPLRLGGGMNGTVGIDHYGLVPIPDRLEGGTLHGAGIFGFRAAAAYLTKIGMKNVEAYLKSLKDYIDAQFKTVKDLEYYYVKSDHPICAFNIQGINPQDLANYLGKKKIIVRAGMSCVKLQSFITNNPTGAVRASFYLYNTKADVDALVLALKTFKKTAILKDLV
jgi:cysteine desulfurase/selenocysteine lyase